MVKVSNMPYLSGMIISSLSIIILQYVLCIHVHSTYCTEYALYIDTYINLLNLCTVTISEFEGPF